VGALSIERRGVSDGSVHTVECTGHQFDRHKRLIRAGKWGSDAKGPGCGETKPGIIARMPDYDHGAVPEMATGFESFFQKCRSDTLALERRVYTQWRQCKGRNAFLGCII
jgi:hypothetical protein